jgi:multidrug transporter EmrE-like cation transporter
VNTGKIIVNALVGQVFAGDETLSSRKLIGLALLTGGILLLLSSNQDKVAD